MNEQNSSDKKTNSDPVIKRQETVAYKASQEIHEAVHTEDSGVYKSLQFENYNLIPNTLKTTFEELFILWNEQARFRTGFKADSGNIYIPNIFAKISGTPSDINEYFNQIAILTQNTSFHVFIKSIPFTFPTSSFKNQSLLNSEGLFDSEKIRFMNSYKLSYLRNSAQNLILSKINELISMENIFNFPINDDFKFKILHTVLNLDKKFFDLFQRFDYPNDIPKLIIYNSSQSLFNQEDYIVIAFLYLCGFDIAILTPTGYNTIENGINSYYYDTHTLEEFKPNLSLPAKITPQKQKKGFWGLFK